MFAPLVPSIRPVVGARAAEWARLLEQGVYASRAELARAFGVSRSAVTQALRRSKAASREGVRGQARGSRSGAVSWWRGGLSLDGGRIDDYMDIAYGQLYGHTGGAVRTFHLPLPDELHDALRDEAKAARRPATEVLREALSGWLATRRRQRLAEEIARFAEAEAGGSLDLDLELEAASLDHLSTALPE